MTRALLFAAAMAFAAAAGAQQYKWIDKDGHVRYGDVPPPGVKATALKPPPAGPAPAAGKGPLTPAEQEAAFRRRQLDAQKKEEKQEQAQKEQLAKQDTCTRAKEELRVLDLGRVSRINANGERYFLDENQIAQERAKANDTVSKSCN